MHLQWVPLYIINMQWNRACVVNSWINFMLKHNRDVKGNNRWFIICMVANEILATMFSVMGLAKFNLLKIAHAYHSNRPSLCVVDKVQSCKQPTDQVANLEA